MFSRLFPLGILALVAARSSAKSLQHIFDTSILADDKCPPQHVTLHVPSSGEGDDEDDINFFHQKNVLKASATKAPVVWTLEKEPNYKDGWRIYWTHPNGNKQYWYDSGDEIRVGGYYSSTIVYIKYAKSDEDAEVKGEKKQPEIALYWNDKCLNYGPENQIWMTDGSLCENVIVRNATLPEWKSSHELCDKLGEKGSNTIHSSL